MRTKWWAWGAVGTLWVARAALAANEPLTLTRTFTSFFKIEPTFSDYNGNGVDDFIDSPGYNTVNLRDGRTGAALRTWTGEVSPDNSFGWSAYALPDVTGDGKRELLIGAPFQSVQPNDRAGVVYAIPSESPGGAVAGNLVGNMPLLYRLDRPSGSTQGAFGLTLGGSGSQTLIGWSSAGLALTVDNTTGVPVARLGHAAANYGSSLGATVAGIGDINGDGTEDYIIGDPNIPTSNGNGEAYLIDGRTSTSGTAWVAVNQLTAPGRLTTFRTTRFSYLGGNGGSNDRRVWANLGDPNTSDSVRQQLLVAGVPNANYYSGGFAAFLVTTDPVTGAVTSTTVAQYQGNSGRPLGSDVVSLGDVNGDGFPDVALLEPGDGGSRRGQVLILSGRGLLDGYDPATDILQQITDPYQGVSTNLRFLGDYDHNGSYDLAINVGSNLRIYSYTPVPEPASASLLLIGAGVRGVRRRTNRLVHREEIVRASHSVPASRV